MNRPQNSESSDSFSSDDGSQVVPHIPKTTSVTSIIVSPQVSPASPHPSVIVINGSRSVIEPPTNSSNHQMPGTSQISTPQPGPSVTSSLLRSSLESAAPRITSDRPMPTLLTSQTTIVSGNGHGLTSSSIIIPPLLQPQSLVKKETGEQDQQDQMTTREAAFLLASLGQVDEKKLSLGVKKGKSDIKLPVNSVAELDHLESQIEDNEDLKAKLLKRLGTIGGKNFGQCVRNALKALMTDVVAVQLNWAGRGGKKPFQSYEIKSVLFDAVRMSFPKVTDFQLKDPVQCWLKRSRNYQPRDLKPKKKSPSTSNSTEWMETNDQTNSN